MILENVGQEVQKEVSNNEVKNTSTRPNPQRKPRAPRRNNRFEKDKEFKEKVIEIRRISKTTKGGRMMRFSIVAVIGDQKGRVGYGTGKSAEIPDAIKKAIKEARKNLVEVKINKKGTIFHEIIGRHGASKVLLKPAKEGTGVVAGGAIRAVIELAGFTNVYTKNMGAKSSLNMITATIDGLKNIRTPQEIAKLRDIDLKNL